MSETEARPVMSVPSIAGAEAWLSSASYWQPAHAPLSAWYEHAPFAFWVVDAIRPRSVVELGTHLGFSYFVFCQAIAQLGLEARAYALDTWEGDAHAGFYDEDVFTSVSQINQAHFASFSQLLRGYFDDSLDAFPSGSVDLLHFDGRHAYEDIKHDFDAWLPKLSTGGVALFHDMTEHKDDFGVWRFWDEIETQYPSFSFQHEHGLGVLGVGEQLPAAMRDFFAATDADADRVRRDYEALGATVREQANTIARAAETDALRVQVSQLVGEVGALNVEISGLQATVDDYRTSTSWKITRPLRAVGSIKRRR